MIFVLALDIKSPDTVGSLSVSLQQIAYTINSDGELSVKNLENIRSFAEPLELGENYNHYIADSVKNYIRFYGNREWN